MSFNTDVDKFWAFGAGAIVAFAWWAVKNRAPDMPFNEWLATASRNDVWAFIFGAVFCAVAFARISVRNNRVSS